MKLLILSRYHEDWRQNSGAPNEGFPLNSLKTPFRATRTLLDLYKICICSVMLGELKSFRNYKGFSIILQKMSRCNLTYYESERFSDSPHHSIFESEILGSLFSTKNSLTSENRREFIR